MGGISMSARTFRAVALATTCLWPLAAHAEDGDFSLDDNPTPVPATKPVLVNEAGTSVGAISGAKGRFNRYGGGSEDGAATSTWFHTESRAAGKEDGTFYFQAEGENIDAANSRVLPDAAALFRFGEQGIWDAGLAYEGIAFQQSDSFRTLFGSSGEYLSSGRAPRSINTTASNANGAARMNQYLSTVDVGTRRDKLTGKLSYSGLPDWALSSKLEHEHKQGTKVNALFFYNTSVFAAIPEPVDYDTDRFTASAAYTTRPVQAKFSYVFSSFTNNQSSFRTVTPFNAGATIPGYQASELSLPPSNQEHRLKAQLGFNPSDTTHVAVNLSSALQLQNEEYTARLYERTPRLPDNSFDGQIRTHYGNVVLTSRPLKDTNLRAAYTLDQRDNRSARTYQEPPYRADGTSAFNGGTAYAAGSTLGRGVHFNAPYSSLSQRADLEVGYRVLKSTKVTLDYNFKDTQRDYAVTARNQESTMGGRVQSTLASGLTGTLGYARGIRQATAYRGNDGWVALGRNPTTPSSEENLRMYAYAARERDEVKANLNWSPAPELSLGLTGRYVNDEFPSTYYGVTGNHMISAGPDITFTPVPEVTTHLYYTYQENQTNMMVNVTAAASGAEWRLKNRDTVHTAGIRTDWQVSDRLKLSAENNVSYGNTAFEEASWMHGGGTLTAVTTAKSLPDNRSITNSLKLSGEYALEDNVFIGLTGLWERFLARDYLYWQEASSAANQQATASVAAEGNPGYSAAVIMATARIMW